MMDTSTSHPIPDGSSLLLPDTDATREAGACLGSVLEPGDIVILTGDLGAGKTCLTGGVAAGLGDPSEVTSPTFTVMMVHDRGRIPLYHFDLYRLEHPWQLDDIGIWDVLDAEGACLIEWGELFRDELGDDIMTVDLTREAPGPRGGEPARRLTVRADGPRSRALAGRFEQVVRERLGQNGR